MLLGSLTLYDIVYFCIAFIATAFVPHFIFQFLTLDGLDTDLL